MRLRLIFLQIFSCSNMLLCQLPHYVDLFDIAFVERFGLNNRDLDSIIISTHYEFNRAKADPVRRDVYKFDSCGVREYINYLGSSSGPNASIRKKYFYSANCRLQGITETEFSRSRFTEVKYSDTLDAPDTIYFKRTDSEGRISEHHELHWYNGDHKIRLVQYFIESGIGYTEYLHKRDTTIISYHGTAEFNKNNIDSIVWYRPDKPKFIYSKGRDYYYEFVWSKKRCEIYKVVKVNAFRTPFMRVQLNKSGLPTYLEKFNEYGVIREYRIYEYFYRPFRK